MVFNSVFLSMLKNPISIEGNIVVLDISPTDLQEEKNLKKMPAILRMLHF